MVALNGSALYPQVNSVTTWIDHRRIPTTSGAGEKGRLARIARLKLLYGTIEDLDGPNYGLFMDSRRQSRSMTWWCR